jgi:polar amino acid transport system permease protein
MDVVLFDWKLVFTQIPEILKAFPTTIELTIIATLIGYVLGLALALVKIHRVPVLRHIGAFYISFLRGTPILVQLYITYYGIPLILKYINLTHGTNYNINSIPAVFFAIVALGLNQSAFDSEVIRAAIESVDKGQLEAARALGMTGGQILRRVILPQSVVVAIPSLGNSLIQLIKGTSLAFTVAVVDLTAAGRILAGRNFRYFEAYCSLAIIYWILTIVLEQVFKRLERHFRIDEQAPAFEGKEAQRLTAVLESVRAEKAEVSAT